MTVQKQHIGAFVMAEERISVIVGIALDGKNKRTFFVDAPAVGEQEQTGRVALDFDWKTGIARLPEWDVAGCISL